MQQAGQMINRMAQQKALDRQTAVAQQQMDIAGRKEVSDIAADKQARAKARVENVGVGLLALLRTPSDETLAQTAQTFKSVGMDPAEYEGVLAQISQMPDANQRKRFALEYIAQSPGAREALKYVMPDVKSEMVGDARVFTDNNPNSPSFNVELFRITASPEPIKTTQNVVEGTLYNTNPVTGVTQEAVMGDATTGLAPQPRTLTRTDSGVVSPYAIQNAAAPRMDGGLPGPRGAGMAVAAPRAPAPMGAPVRGATPAASLGASIEQVAQQLSPGVVVSGRARTPERNAQVGGVPDSYHLTDNARDFQPGKGQTVDGLFKNLSALKTQGFDVIKERDHVHIEPGPGMRPAAALATPRAGTPVATPTGRQTVAEAATRKAFGKILPIIGYDANTGKNRVTDLIKASTSGGAEMIGSEVKGFFGEATPGRKALGELSAIAENMTFEKLKGKLGAQISNADVQLIARTMADVANGNTPANVRAAAWNNVVLPILLRGAGVETPPASKTSTGERQTPTATPVIPTLTPEQVKANPSIKRWKRADNGEVMVRQ
jgi:hypothetical protein